MPLPAGHTIALEDPRSAVANALITELNAVLAAEYDPEFNHFVDGDFLAGQGACFLVARDGDGPVACGAAVPLGDGAAEIKRMWTTPRARGRGLGRALLDALEDWAREQGLTRLVLETGSRQAEAQQLYATAGFESRGPCGDYTETDYNLFFEKTLADMAAEPC